MNNLLRHQVTKSSFIKNFSANSRKVAAATRTAGYYKARISVLNRYWDEFCSKHEEIVNIAVSGDESKKYFQEDVFGETETNYVATLADHQDSLDLLLMPIPTGGAGSEHSSTTIMHDPITVRQSVPVTLPNISIPKFKGDYIEWPSFKDLFSSLIIGNTILSDVQRLHYLKANLGGEAEQLLRSVTITDANFRTAWETLEDTYENKRLIVGIHLREIMSQPEIVKESASDIKRLISSSLKALSNLGRPIQHWDDFLVFATVQKFDPSTRKDWEDSISDTTDLPEFATLEKFLTGRVRTLEAIAASKSSTTIAKIAPVSKPLASQVKSHQTSASSTISSSASRRCPLCPNAKPHHIGFCSKFRKKNVAGRHEIVKSNSLCQNCLGGDHLSKDCSSTYSCKTCNLRHHSRTQSADLPTESVTSSALSSTAKNVLVGANLANKGGNANTVLLATAWVMIRAQNGAQFRLRCLLDQGSQASFISESAVQLLKLQKQKANVTVVGISASTAATSKLKVSFEFTSCYDFGQIFQTCALVLEKLTSYVPKCTVPATQWDHLINIQLADPDYFEPSRIDVVFGADAYANLIREGIRRGCPGSPTAQNAALGWILSGQTQDISACSNFSISVPSHHVLLSDNMEKQLRQFWEVEEISQDVPHLTDDEIECEHHYQQTHRRDSEGRYVVRLPIKSDKIQRLGSTKAAAISRLYSMERKFKRDPDFEKNYIDFLTSYKALGHMQPISDNSNENASYYLPHHGVLKESSTSTKLRVVFDASQMII